MPVLFLKFLARMVCRCLILALLASSVVVRGQPLSAAGTNAASELVAWAGRAEYCAVNTTNWQPAPLHLALSPGDRLRTFDNSRATLQLSDRSVIRIGPNTMLEIRPPSAPARRRFRLHQGWLFFLDREKPADVEFETPLATGAIRGTEFALEVAENDAATRLALFDGAVELKMPGGTALLTKGQEVLLSSAQPARISAVLPAVNLIQWAFYYPGVLNPDEIHFSDSERTALAESLAAWRSGDLLAAIKAAPAEMATQSEACRLYFAGLKLAVGDVAKAEELISSVGDDAIPLREVIAAVKFQNLSSLRPPVDSSSWLARSYYLQSRSRLPEALAAAKTAATLAPSFGFAQARLAELEFGFEHRRAALDALAQAKKLSPRHAPAVALGGFIALADSRPQSALAQFDQAIDLDDSLPIAWVGRALAEAALFRNHEARRDLQVAATLEPQRGIFRSYLGKAWSQTSQDNLAQKEFALAKTLDPADPTAWLYAALQKFQIHQINGAVDDLERSVERNDNRSVFRPRLQLDRDRAMRSADLAAIYDAAGLTEVSQASAYRAVNESYSDFAGHLFLANSFAAQEDPRQFNLRFETPRESELLIANLLAPSGGGNLSQLLSQQDHLQYFDPRPFGLSSQTEYFSGGDWSESATAFGQIKTLSYAFDVLDLFQNGQRPNNDLSEFQFAFHARQQVTPADSLYFSVDTLNRRNGDVAQYYSQTNFLAHFRAKETQAPNLFLGWNHEWSAGSHTLLLLSRLTDRLSLTNPQPSVLFIEQDPSGIAGVTADPFLSLNQVENFTMYSAEAQQIWESDQQALILGGRFQHGDVDSSSTLTRLFGATTKQSLSSAFERGSGYAYYLWRPVNALQLIGGFSEDELRYPRNVDLPPQSPGEESRALSSPKVGLTAEPWQGGWLHAAWTRSLGGLFFDNSIRLEPAVVAGSVSAYRSLIPESVEGIVPGTRFETWAIGLDQKLESRTYFGVGAELLTSDGSRLVGAFSNSIPFILTPDSPTDTRQTLDFRERNVSAYLAQLIGQNFSVGARYRLSEARLETALPALAGVSGITSLDQNQRAVLQNGELFLIYNNPHGFFAEWVSDWFHQDNHADLAGLPGDDFWQHNCFVGYVFPHRRAELRAGLLNITDRDYHLDPLNLQSELARRRTFTASFRVNF